MLFSIKNKCLEIKKLYSGLERQYLCDLIYLEKPFGILQFILDKDYHVGNLFLPKGTISLGFFWENRPYNIYQWFDKEILIASYFNISDSTQLFPNKFVWRDLILDILITANSSYKILDEDELEIIKDKEIMQYIRQSKLQIIQDYKMIIKDLDNFTHKHLLLK